MSNPKNFPCKKWNLSLHKKLISEKKSQTQSEPTDPSWVDPLTENSFYFSNSDELDSPN